MKLDQVLIDRMIELAKFYGATRLILFGSALNNPEKARDIDLACDIPGWDFFAYGAKLEDEFLIPIDLVPLTPPNPFTEHIES
ncbi:MAG: DNA polymerase III subunit beta, partial [Candidatus Omnitrophota bacterium]